jgi:DNA modification methylase
MKELPDESVHLVVTSPPYWDVVDYGVEGQIGPGTYEHYLDEMLAVWQQASRVLVPNGKMAIVTPIMPIPKTIIGDQHTRHLKNIGADIEHSILANVPELLRYAFFVWQKQTSVKMFGSYPYPPNLYEDNTIESINVFVKEGKPIALQGPAKEASRLSQSEWRNLTQQVWPIYPADVKRSNHPAPFPVTLPLRAIMMYTYARSTDHGFGGDIVLDMFNGSGSTCLAAKALQRNYIGIDLNEAFCDAARRRLAHEAIDPHEIMLERVRVRGATNSRQEDLFGGSLDGEDEELIEDERFREG